MADVVMTCVMRVNGIPCEREAIAIDPVRCEPCDRTNTEGFCLKHYESSSRQTWQCTTCGALTVHLEPIYLTKADPGPGYADMLRSL